MIAQSVFQISDGRADILFKFIAFCCTKATNDRDETYTPSREFNKAHGIFGKN